MSFAPRPSSRESRMMELIVVRRNIAASRARLICEYFSWWSLTTSILIVNSPVDALTPATPHVDIWSSVL